MCQSGRILMGSRKWFRLITIMGIAKDFVRNHLPRLQIRTLVFRLLKSNSLNRHRFSIYWFQNRWVFFNCPIASWCAAKHFKRISYCAFRKISISIMKTSKSKVVAPRSRNCCASMYLFHLVTVWCRRSRTQVRHYILGLNEYKFWDASMQHSGRRLPWLRTCLIIESQ